VGGGSGGGGEIDEETKEEHNRIYGKTGEGRNY
jgi:hypothetical protein